MNNPRKTLIDAINRVYKKGLTTTSGGNLSVIDDKGDIFITPSGKDKGTLSLDDIVQVVNGVNTHPTLKPSMELPFHSRIFKLRPEVKAVLHVHSPFLVTYSLFNRAPKTDILTIASEIGKVGLSTYEIPGSIDLGLQISEVIKDGYNSVMMQNHGVVIVAPTMEEAYRKLELLELLAEINYRAIALGGAKSITDVPMSELSTYKIDSQLQTSASIVNEISLISKRCYDHHFFTAGLGVISYKIKDGEYYIIGDNSDREFIKQEDIIVVNYLNNTTSANVDKAILNRHSAIYQTNIEVKAIIQGYAPNIMAFATTGADIDSRTIPESYIMMRDMMRLPLDVTPMALAKSITNSTPNAIIANDCVIATGETLTKAFDRYEVSEVTAMTLINSCAIGTPCPITDYEIEKINRTFNLPL